MKGETFSMVENTCGGPAIVAFDYLELLIMSSGINRLRAATAKNAGALNYMPQISPSAPAHFWRPSGCSPHFHASDGVSVRLEIFDLGRGIFGDAGQEISALRQVRRLKA